MMKLMPARQKKCGRIAGQSFWLAQVVCILNEADDRAFSNPETHFGLSRFFHLV